VRDHLDSEGKTLMRKRGPGRETERAKEKTLSAGKRGSALTHLEQEGDDLVKITRKKKKYGDGVVVKQGRESQVQSKSRKQKTHG